MDKAQALKILGFSPNEEPDKKQIKKAFKKKAVKLHPDVNKADDADKQFKELNAAQEYLINPPAPPFQGFPQGGVHQGGFPFQDMFGGARVNFVNIQPIRKTVKISFKESVLGGRQKFKVDKSSKCEDCKCKECDGLGVKERTTQRGNVMFSQRFQCHKCKAYGRESGCSECNSTGVIKKMHEYSINVPGGIKNGNSSVLKGFGNVESFNGMLYTGDIILTVNVEPDKDMRIDGINVISTIDISLLEALQGTKKKVRTVLGDQELKIKKNTKNKETVILGKHGVEKKGNHIFTINVHYPTDTEKLIEALKEE